MQNARLFYAILVCLTIIVNAEDSHLRNTIIPRPFLDGLGFSNNISAADIIAVNSRFNRDYVVNKDVPRPKPKLTIVEKPAHEFMKISEPEAPRISVKEAALGNLIRDATSLLFEVIMSCLSFASSAIP